MAIEWADSAAKHGLSREDVLNAMANYVLHLPGFDEPRVPGRGRPDLFVGPPVQRGGALIEVMAEQVPPRTLVIFHAMPARAKFLALLDEGE